MMKMTKNINEIGERYDLEFIVTFGSYGTQRFTEESDIDVAFYAKREMDYATEEALLIEIIQYFRRDKIDLINLRKAPILLKKEVASNGKVLYQKPYAFVRFQSKAFKLFQEMKPMLDRRAAEISRQIRER